MPTLQECIDAFIRHYHCRASAERLPVEQCMEALTLYLIHYSDLFDDQEFPDESEYADWEENLEAHMNELLQGDIEPAGDLGQLQLEALDPEHLRDFLGWFMLRESGDSACIRSYAESLKAWIGYVSERGWLSRAESVEFSGMVDDVAPAAMRVARLSQVLFHFVRSGTGVPPRLRGLRFRRFVEGHGRVSAVTDGGLCFSFDHPDQTAGDEAVGPVWLPRPIVAMVEPGDVFDIEMGLRGDSWVMVDIGPVYPACVYVEVEEYRGFEKIS